jgi:CheY-like chemotaxis protein
MTKILLVEDNQLNREMFARRLERKGFQVVTAGDGQDALQKARSETVGLILMDLSLPVLDGWEATRRLKADPATRSIPVIAMTAHAMVGDRQKALAAGCDDYQTKPVDLPELLAKINALAGPVLGLPQRPQLTRAPAPRFVPAPPPNLSPAARAPAERRLPQAASTALHPSSSAAILVVDDNPLNQDLLSRRLERDGFQVALARDGKEALHCVYSAAFDLILLDLMMPEMNGIEVLRAIRTSYSMAALPVIVLTAKDQGEDMVTALNLGANDYITKPFSYPVLLARLRNQLALKQSHRIVGTAMAASSAPPAVAARMASSLPLDRSRSNHSVQKPAAVATKPAYRSDPEMLTLEAPRGDGRAASHSSGYGLFPGKSAEHDGPSPATWTDGATLVEGDTFADYEILHALGRGSMGVLYKARHARMNRLVALKLFHNEYVGCPNATQRFYREIQAVAQLNHRNIVQTYDVGRFSGTHFLAMEYVDGLDLDRLVKEQSPLAIKVVRSFALQTARGLHHAHEQNLIHRDIKPSNLFATWPDPSSVTDQAWSNEAGLRQLERATIKILDFGVALLYESADPSKVAAGLMRDGRVGGTADFRAPEQWTNAHQVEIGADLYCLGATVYYLLTGQVPFPGGEAMEKMLKHHLDEPVPVEKLRPEVPAALGAIVRRLMAKNPTQRFRQACEVLEALEAL